MPAARIEQGSGSGLDADTVDGIEGAGYLRVNGENPLDPVTEPTAPSSGMKLYVDSADGSLKAKDSSGSVTTIVS